MASRARWCHHRPVSVRRIRVPSFPLGCAGRRVAPWRAAFGRLGGRVFGWALAALALGCDANLETTCVGGDCADYQPPPGVIEVPECFEGCDTTAVSGNVGEYPCEVEPIIEVCRSCHVDGGTAPFSLDTYADSQELYGSETRWARIVPNVTSDFMPLGGPPLDADQKKALLDDWACQCAPPRAAGVACE